MENILFALDAVLPIVILIALGYMLKKIGLFTSEFLTVANKFCFRVLLPVTLFLNIYKIEDLSAINWSAAAFCVCGIVGAFLLGLIVVRIFVPERRQKGAVLQCVFRSNYAIIGIPLAEMIFGELGRETASVMSAFTIPVFNVLAVVALTMYVGAEDEKKSFGKQLKATLVGIAKNPLIIAVVAGVIVVLVRRLLAPSGFTFRISDIKFLYTSLNFVSALTTPLALIVLGGQFEFNFFKDYLKLVAVGTIVRTVVVPAVVLSLACFAFGFRGADVATFIAVFGSPVAVASAIMAREMGSDGDLAGALVVSTTIVSTFTLIIMITVLSACGVFA